MTKEPNFVECSRCLHWSDKDRYFKACDGCHNTKKTIDPKEILCNRCGGPQRPLGTHNEQYPHGLEAASVTGGYESYHLFDMTTYKFSICEKCLRELFNQFQIKPTVIDQMSGADEIADPWAQDQEWYEYRVWKDNGGHHQAYLNKTCNMRKDCPNKAVYTRRINGDFSEDCCCEEHRTKDGGSIKHVKFIPNVLKPFL